jgi:hypothetical protein
MPGEMTKEAVKAWKAGLERANEAEVQQLRETAPTEKLLQLDRLMTFADELGWNAKRADEDAEVRRRWQALKRLARG